eukprot:scaffold14.g1191.t1
MAFFRGAPVDDDTAREAAVAVEKKAYTVARVEARTTTGVRPHHETMKAYVRKLSALVLEVVEDGGQLEGVAPKAGVKGEELDLTGSREFLTAETAEEALVPMLAPGARISKARAAARHGAWGGQGAAGRRERAHAAAVERRRLACLLRAAIKFSTKSFGVDAARVAARAIQNVKSTLVDADMSDIIAGRPEAEALEALGIISAALGQARLHHLNLSDNALGEKGIRACAAAFANQSALESIAFQNVGCSVHGCRAVDELLQNTASLKRLHLLNNMSGDEGAAAIARLVGRCPALQDFKMVSSRVGADGGLALATALAAGTSLVRLDLHDNPLTGEFAEDLAAALARQPHLHALVLNDTSLGDEGVGPIAAALAAAAPQLEELELALNEITAEGAGAVGALLAAKPRLRRVNLRENELEDAGALAVARGVAGLTALEALDLCANQIRRGGAAAVAKACAGKPALALLALDENEISEAGVDALREIMATVVGKPEALGSLDENMPEEEEEEDEGPAAVAADAAADALAASLAKAAL